jgi:mRNA (2'-O-methyladenosine-N6-)-methyltransferase
MDLKSNLVASTSHPPLYLSLPGTSPSEITSPLLPNRFDVILITPPPDWDETSLLPIRSLSADPGFVFLWVGEGHADGLERGRECFAKWGFRRAEDIVWVKTNRRGSNRGAEDGGGGGGGGGGEGDIQDQEAQARYDSSGQNTSQSQAGANGVGVGGDGGNGGDVAVKTRPNGDGTGGVFAGQKEHCLMGIRGTVRRSTDHRFVHCNVDTDVMVWEDEGEWDRSGAVASSYGAIRWYLD